MLDLNDARRLIVRELDAVERRLEALSDVEWERPVRCAGWTVTDVVVHVAAGLPMAADALRRMRAGVAEPALDPPLPQRRRPVLTAAIRAGRRKLVEALDALSHDSLSNLCPFSFVTLPGAAGMNLLALEAGTHRNDLEWALGNEEPLPSDVVRAAASILTGILLYGARRAAEVPEASMTYALTGPALVVSLAFRGGSWQPANGERAQTCVIAGEDSALTLFALGRIPADHSSLTVTGDEALARAFKRYLPGP